MPKFGEYIEQLINYINGNPSIREYKTQSIGGEVVSSILEIVENRLNEEIVLLPSSRGPKFVEKCRINVIGLRRKMEYNKR